MEKQFRVQVMFKDESPIEILVPEEKMQHFFDSVNSGKVYYNEALKYGFWTNVHDIRYMQIFEIEQEKPKVEKSGKAGKSKG